MSKITTKEGRLTRMPKFGDGDGGRRLPEPIEDVWGAAEDVTESEDEEMNPPYDPSDSPDYAQGNEELL